MIPGGSDDRVDPVFCAETFFSESLVAESWRRYDKGPGIELVVAQLWIEPPVPGEGIQHLLVDSASVNSRGRRCLLLKLLRGGLI